MTSLLDTYKNKKVLVFVGGVHSWIVGKILEEDAEYITVRRLSTGHKVLIPKSKLYTVLRAGREDSDKDDGLQDRNPYLAYTIR